MMVVLFLLPDCVKMRVLEKHEGEDYDQRLDSI